MRVKPVALVAAFAFAAAALLQTSARADDPSPSPGAGTGVNVVASTSLAPLARAAAAKYGLQYAGIAVNVTPNDSNDALRAIAAGTADVALTDRAPADATLLDHRIAVLPFAFVANRADGASSLTAKQIAGLLTGTISNWNQVGGANVPVKIVSRGAASGVTQLIERKFLGGKKATAADVLAPATGTAIDEVKRTPGALSVVTFDAARVADASVVSLAIDGASPDESHVGDGSYPLWAYEHAVTAGAPSTQTSRFLSLIQSDRTMLHGLGFIAVSDLGPGALAL